jgi:uncharacterized membrane protein YhaH (DUF805 family)
MGRITYLNAGLLAWVGLAMIGIGAAVLLPMSRSWLMFIPLAVAFVLFFVWAIRVTVLRLHDMNRSGWWVLVTLIPYVGWVASLVLMFMPGTPEDNDYGEKPKRGSTARGHRDTGRGHRGGASGDDVCRVHDQARFARAGSG